MFVSVLLPSRGRPNSLVKSIDSLIVTAADPGAVEVLVGYDSDDLDTPLASLGCAADFVEFPKRHGYHNLHLYVNRLAEQSSGNWLLLWNDDAIMTTEGWDEVFGNFDPTCPHVLNLSSTGYGHSLCCFPAVSRCLYQQLGHLSLSPHIDTWLQDLGRETRIIRNIDVHVYHDRHDLTGGHNDQTRAESLTGYRTDEFYGFEIQSLLKRDIEKVKQ